MRATPNAHPQDTEELNRQFLENELHGVDLLIRKRVVAWESAGQDPDDAFRGLRIRSDEALSIASQPLWGSWGTSGGLTPDLEERFSTEEQAVSAERQGLLEQARERSIRLRLLALTGALGLSAFEYGAFLVCLAASLDLRYERLFGFLQNDVTRKSPGVNLILDLLLPPGSGRLVFLDCFREGAPLLRLGLLRPVQDPPAARPILSREFMAAPEVVSWILGQYAPAPEIAGGVRLLLPPFTDLPRLDERTFASVDWPSARGGGAILALSGPDPLRQLFAAQRAAEQLGQPLLVIDLAGIKTAAGPEPAWLRLALRDSALLGAVPLLAGWDALLAADAALQEAVLQELAWFPGPFLTSSAAPWNPPGARPVLRWEFTLPSFAERCELWRHFLGAACPLSEGELELLAGQFMLTSAQVQAAAQEASHQAAQAGRPLAVADLLAATRKQTSHHLDSLALRIKPRYTWQDIVLPEEELAILHEIVATVRGRVRVLDEWGLGKKLVPNPGIAVLFAGPPGTGKTLSAQVIAAELSMDLYRIDLSTVVSKYIGETEKNLERIFSQAANSNTILFFDEADAIFGKRSDVKDAHDRYANIEISYLLQRIETYDGVAILASNLRSNLDEAFVRRLQFIVDFPFPDETQRLRIWKVLFPPGIPQLEPLDFESFARRFKLSGGNIRNVIVNAAFAAASDDSGVSNRHLMHAVRRELQKMGRLINDKELSI